MNIGEATLNFTAKTEELDKQMNDLFDRIERTVQAARQAWNLIGCEGTCDTPHHLDKVSGDRKHLVQNPHPQESSCKNWRMV